MFFITCLCPFFIKLFKNEGVERNVRQPNPERQVLSCSISGSGSIDYAYLLMVMNFQQKVIMCTVCAVIWSIVASPLDCPDLAPTLTYHLKKFVVAIQIELQPGL